MTDIDNHLPTPREALVQGYQRLQLGEIEAADTWIRLARELREGGRPARSEPLTLHDVEGIVCAHGRVAVRRHGGPGTWFLHTDDGSTCDGPENQTETDWMRRRAATPEDIGADEPPERLAFSETAKLLDVSRLRPQLADGLDATVVLRTSEDEPGIDGAQAMCRWDGMPIEWRSDREHWVHVLSQQRVCVGGRQDARGDETHHPNIAHTFAEPAA